MNISKDGKTLYFSDEEIDNETNRSKEGFCYKENKWKGNTYQSTKEGRYRCRYKK